MFTVIVGLLPSGNSSTRKPFPNVYSQMPSTQGPATTPFDGGAPSAATAMGAWSGALSDDEIWDVLAYVRTFREE